MLLFSAWTPVKAHVLSGIGPAVLATGADQLPVPVSASRTSRVQRPPALTRLLRAYVPSLRRVRTAPRGTGSRTWCSPDSGVQR